MSLPTKCEYLIIGAGIHGLSTAWHLCKKLSKKGFKLKKTHDNQLILHHDPKVFDQWGFISEELPFKQLCLISDEE